MSLIGVFHRYTYIFHGYSGISVVFRYFGDSCDPIQVSRYCLSKDLRMGVVIAFWRRSQLTPNMLGSIGMTCRSKTAKIVQIGNPRWPPWQPSWNSIFRYFSWTERPMDSKFARKHRGDLFKQSAWILLKMFVLMISRSSSKLVTWGKKLGHLAKSAVKLITLGVTFLKQSSWILLKNVCLDDF